MLRTLFPTKLTLSWVPDSAICPFVTCSHTVFFLMSPDLFPEEQAEEGLYNHRRWGGQSLSQSPGCFLWQLPECTEN